MFRQLPGLAMHPCTCPFRLHESNSSQAQLQGSPGRVQLPAGGINLAVELSLAAVIGAIGSSGDKGRTAEDISVAAFASLSLAFSFTQVSENF